MADQPTGGAELSDDDLDDVVNGAWGDEDETPTVAPAAAAPEPDEPVDTSDPLPADNAPAGDAPPVADATAQPAPGAASASPAPVVGTPFQFKASGRDHTLPWASQLPDGSVVIPKEQQAEFRRELASGRELHANFVRTKQDFDRRIQEAQSHRTEKDAEADAVIGMMSDLLKRTPEEQWAYLQEMAGNFPKLQLDLERKQIDERRKLIEQQDKARQPSPEQQQQQVTQSITAELDSTFQWAAQQPEFQALTPEERETVKARWAKKPGLLVRRATQDDPANGITKGDVLFDPSDVLDDLRFLASHKPKAAPKAAAVNAARNADLATQSANRIPPAVRASAPSGPPRDKKTGKFKTASDRSFKDYLMSDEDEDDAA